MKVVWLVVAMVAVLLGPGCGPYQMPLGSGLNPGVPTGSAIDRRAKLAKVEISDPKVPDKGTMEDSLSLNLVQYLNEARYFKDAMLFSGKADKDDLILRFQFARYRLDRSVHPWYFPAAFFTLTFYIWFGGPVAVQTSDLSGKLIVEDAAGTVVTTQSANRAEKKNLSLYSAMAQENLLPGQIKDRTSLVKEMIDKAVADIQQKGMVAK